MSEYIGVIDEIGNGQANMYVTSEPIVRCRDCVWFVKDANLSDVCNPHECMFFKKSIDLTDGFCAWGEGENV